MYKIPILFIIFKRKDLAIQVMRAISKVRPKILYISQDGPGTHEDELKLLETRKAVMKLINWNCDLKVQFHKKNLGVRDHPITALSWFFKENEYGIYLEDDTLPSTEFFYFQRAMLKKFKKNKRVFMINGANFYSRLALKNYSYSYYLSRILCGWGFGLWRRSWELYDPYIKNYFEIRSKNYYRNAFFNEKQKFYLDSFLIAIKKELTKKTFTPQILYAVLKNDMYFVFPSGNLIKNIGSNKEASNPSLQSYEMNFEKVFPLKHPKKLVYDKQKDIVYFNNLLSGGWIRLIGIRIYLFSPAWLKTIIKFLSVGFIKKFSISI